MIFNYLLHSIVDSVTEGRRHCTRRTWRCRTTKNHMARRARRLIARRIIARKPRSPFALDSKYITIYITQTFNNIQNVPYIYTRLNYTIQWCTNFGPNLVLSARAKTLDPIWNENKWQIKLDLNWENKSIFPNYIIELMREKEKEKEGRENFKNKIAQIIFISY